MSAPVPLQKTPGLKNTRSFFYEGCVVAARLLTGGALLTGGVAALLAPTAELTAAIRNYAVLPAWMAPWLAQGLPWVEAVLGLAVILGLSQRFSLRAAAMLLTLFWFVISQALLRRLPLGECGCFGDLLSLSPRRMWALDAALVTLAWWLVRRHTPTVSVDHRLAR